MENPIVLDSKWVDLHNEHIIWYALVQFFCCRFRSMFFFIAIKNCTKAYHIICSLCRSTHLESNTIWFSILWFFCDLLWFFKTDLGGNLTGFGKFRGWYRRFHSLGGYVDQPHSWGGDIDFFPMSKCSILYSTIYVMVKCHVAKKIKWQPIKNMVST